MEKTYVKWAKRYRLYISHDERLKTWIRRMVPGLGRGLGWPSPPDPRASRIPVCQALPQWTAVASEKHGADHGVWLRRPSQSQGPLRTFPSVTLSRGEASSHPTPWRPSRGRRPGRGGLPAVSTGHVSRPPRAPATWAGHPGERPSAQPQGFGGLQPPHGGLWPAPSGQVTPRFLTLGNRVR